MKVTYNGFTGELVKLERKETIEAVFDCNSFDYCGAVKDFVYDLSIYDSEKKVTHSFTGVKMADMEFLGGAVSFK